MDARESNRATMPTEAEKWRAIVARDRHSDGGFWYGVATTGVFCRPSCASRRPRRDNVRFFASPGAATAAGFRACKRCAPLAAGDRQAARIEDVARYIEAHADEPLPLARLAARARLSPAHFQRRFKARLGVSPKAYQDGIRLERLKAGLRTGAAVLDAIVGAGFSSTSRVYGEAARNLGMTPSAYRAGGAGETIAYACRQTALGLLMMAATDRGVCFAQFGASEDALRRGLAAEFPKATLAPSAMAASPELEAWIRAFEAHLGGDAPRPEVPLDLRGTAFQIRVWRFLLGIGEGDVLSYAEVAAGIGAPQAVRAAASACGANRIAVLVPCHRVLRGDGGLGGYRWGLERKRALLDRERAARRSRPTQSSVFAAR
jgi:AraC family transcriptional regulator, regulatory protein of adaptative response / methylated-DNA-[protein]-cysteine methyltransferase